MDKRADDSFDRALGLKADSGLAPEALTALGPLGLRPWRILVGLLVIGILAVAILIGMRVLRASEAPLFTTEKVRMGDLEITVSVTGILQPLNKVDVGSELSGAVEKVLVEENEVVRKGQVLAVLDTSRLADQIALSRASLASAQANLEGAQATEREQTLKLERLRDVWQRSRGDFVSRADVDAAEAARDRAAASVASARASVAQAQASLRTNRTNLGKATIRSPISGVVLTRAVEPGQTVAASFQAPVLFTLAEDLSHMKLEIDVDEAEVANVRPGQHAQFTVDAFPGRNYPATVTRISLGSHTTSGVVSYTGILAVENADLTLRPGMTASAEIASDRRTNVLLAPDAALRFRPRNDSQPAAGGGILGALAPKMPGAGGRGRPMTVRNDPNAGQVWILEDGEATRLPVRIGATDGRFAEVSSERLKPGMAVIVGARDDN